MDFAKHRAKISVACDGCGHELTVQPKQIADGFGWVTKTRDVEKKLVCNECGKKRARLVPVPDETVVRRMPLDPA